MVGLPRRSHWLAIAALLVMAWTPVYAQDPATPTAEDEPESKTTKYCKSLPEEKRRQTLQCKTEQERREDAYEQVLKERAEREKPTNSSFLRWFHLDTGWTTTNFSGGLVGLVGTHVTVANIDRVNFFGPPGVMLLLKDTPDGQTIRPALTWGVSIYLAHVRLPGAQTKSAQLYLNLTKVWETGSYENGFDMAGLSLTWKK